MISRFGSLLAGRGAPARPAAARVLARIGLMLAFQIATSAQGDYENVVVPEEELNTVLIFMMTGTTILRTVESLVAVEGCLDGATMNWIACWPVAGRRVRVVGVAMGQ